VFTGIVESKGSVRWGRAGRLEVSSDLEDLKLGESVAVNGVCLTVVSADAGTFAADVSEETLSRSCLGSLPQGAAVNLERAMPATGRFGGHVVQGHVDGVGKVVELTPREGSVEMWFSIPSGLGRYLVEKGSITVDGVSLTVCGLEEGRFSVALVPHTLEQTNLGSRLPGDGVNIEVDILAKYVERLLASAGPVDPDPRRYL
jgi:riboflavin synthase